jgi:Ca2+-binding RTX toxin-like protein
MSQSGEKNTQKEPLALVAVDDHKGAVVFGGESAGYLNAVGMYKIAADGTISDVEIIFANASLKGDGGDLLAGKSRVDVDFESGDRVGFFIVPDGYSQSGMAKLLADTKGSFKLVDAKGNAGNVDGGVELKLVHVAQNGKETDVKSAYGTTLFHSVDDGSKGLNGDKLDHVKTSIDVEAGTMTFGFEDLKGGGDKDFDDAVFTVNIGKGNAEALATGTAEAKLAEKQAQAEADAKAGGKGPNDDDDKHDGRGHGDGDHNDDGRPDNGKGPGDKKDDDKGRDKDKGKDKDDDDKNDGRGDGDHNDDGHPDNGKGPGDKAEDDEADVTPTNPVDALVVSAKDVLDFDPGLDIVGDGKENDLVGETGADSMSGRGGDDRLVAGKPGSVTVPLTIDVQFMDGDRLDLPSVLDGKVQELAKLSILVGNVPEGAKLSAGRDNGDGSWSLDLADLAGLTITTPEAMDFKLTVSASTSGVSNLVAGTDVEVTMLVGAGNVMQGNGGNDTLVGGASGDVMYGGSKPSGIIDLDKVHVATVADDDVLFGGDGNDIMYGNSGSDELYGEAGNDAIYGGKDNDLVDGGEGDDILYGNSGNDTIFGGSGNDLLEGGAGDDELWDDDGADVVNGGSGDDLVIAGEGDDVYNGNSGFDTIDFSGSTGSMTIDLSKKTAVGMGDDVVSGFESVTGSTFDDYMKGSKRGEALDGGEGDDVLRGLGGADTLTGGEGSDTFQWSAKDVLDVGGDHLGVDVVTDFSGEDVLDFRQLLKGQAWESIDDVVLVKDDGQSSHVYAQLGDAWVEVATLENFSGFTASDMMKDGMLLV